METDIDGGSLDLKQLFFNKLQLLGFDAQAMEVTNRIPFNSAMFNLPNKRGAEIVLHFLFQRLNPTMCKEAFRDCWPIHNKELEQEFRKACSGWLTNISKEEPDSCLPRINASLFMSPGGQKFYQLLFYFSTYVLQKVMDTELGVKSSERMKHPTITTQNAQLSSAMGKVGICSAIRDRKTYFRLSQLLLKVNKMWKDSADEMVKEHRKLSKGLRDVDYNIRQEEQRSVEACTLRGSPAKKRGFADELDPDFDPRTIKRAQRIQQVRDMWKQLEDYDRSESAEREVVESIVERTVNKYKLDGGDVSVKVPDMLLRECGDEIRHRNIANTYQGGKLNIVSVLQLWNLALNLYLEKFKQVGVPKLDGEAQKLTSVLHMQQSYQQNSHTLRQQMADHIPTLKASIEQLRDKLDQEFFPDDPSLDTLRKTSVGLDLMGPSPKPSFSPGAARTPAEKVEVPRLTDTVATPEAEGRIREEMQAKAGSRRQPVQLFAGADFLQEPKDSNKESSIPQPTKPRSQASSRHSSRPVSARSNTSTRSATSARSVTSGRSAASSKGKKSSAQTTPKAVRAEHAHFEHRNDESAFEYVASPRTAMQGFASNRSVGEERLNSSLNVGLNLSGISQQSSGTLSARSEKSSSTVKSHKSDRFGMLSDRSSSTIKSLKSDRSGTLSARSDKSSSTIKSHKSEVSTPRSEKSGKSEQSGRSALRFDSPRSARFGASQSGSNVKVSSEHLYGRTDYAAGDGRGDHPSDGVQKKGRRSLTDLLVDEIMGEGEILSPFNSGLEAFESRNIVIRSPDADKENITPVDIVTVMLAAQPGQLTEENSATDFPNMENSATHFPHTENSATDFPNMENSATDFPHMEDTCVDSDPDTLSKEAWKLAKDDLDQDGLTDEAWKLVKDDLDKDVDTRESWMMAGDHGGGGDIELLSEEMPPDGVEDYEAEFEDILGPELDEEYDNDTDTSQRSTERVIVIDHSVSPKHEATRSGLEFHQYSPREGVVVDERGSSGQHSPRDIIVIDRSFHQSPRATGIVIDRSFHQSPMATGSPRRCSGPQLNESFPSAFTPDRVSLTKDELSQSLVHERSPLKDEIRKMFKEALADTGSHGGSPRHRTTPRSGLATCSGDRTGFSTGGLRQQSSELELPNMDPDSREAESGDDNHAAPGHLHGDSDSATPGQHVSLDQLCDETELLENIQMTDDDGGLIEGIEDCDTFKHQQSDVPFDIQLSEFSEEINDFFKQKTPELPSRNVGRTSSPTLDMGWLKEDLQAELDNVRRQEDWHDVGLEEELDNIGIVLQTSGEAGDIDALITFTP